jgi:anti-anti-sigma factor
MQKREDRMSLSTEKFAVVVCRGEIRSEDDITELSKGVNSCGVDVKAVVLIIEGVSFVNSHGLGQLISIHTELKNRGARFCLVGAQMRVRETLQITNLQNSFECFISIGEALSALSVK